MEFPNESTHGPFQAGDCFMFDGQRWTKYQIGRPFIIDPVKKPSFWRRFWNCIKPQGFFDLFKKETWRFGKKKKSLYESYFDTVVSSVSKRYNIPKSELTKPMPCTGNCGMNYCDENGCMERKRESTPLPKDLD